MSILDDAIREHLELKRAHGADANELKKLEDEAFGPPARPDQLDSAAEAPTEFMATEGGAEAEEAEAGGRRVPNIADLQEAPPPPEPELAAEESAEDALPTEPADEEHPAMEHEVPEPEPTPLPEPDASHSTGEREAIAEQPTEHFDVQAELESAEQAASPSDEELVDAELSEPRISSVEPAAAAEPEEEDDFFSEQRLSDELSKALDAPIDDEEDEFAALGDEEEHEEDEPSRALSDQPEDAGEHEEEEDAPPAPSSHEDVLEDTPEFLEDTPEDDDLWFEQRPPKDFDFDD